MPVGSGAVGKTSLALTLEKATLPPNWESLVHKLQKSQNLEFRYVTDQVQINGARYHVLHQYLVPPGQTAIEITEKGRSFDEVIHIYSSVIRRVDVVLLSYKITDLDTYHQIEYWVEKVNDITNEKTNLILVGTHLDKTERREVTTEMVKAGKQFVWKLMKNIRPGWEGVVSSMEVSNTSGENVAHLRKLISGAIILAAGVSIPTQK